MAVNIFDKYGIKEVANVYFEALEDEPKFGVYEGDIVLFLDTLKVSTIETSAENVAAQGGWGNPRLVQWDYGKEINITLEDALMSLESLRFMLGGAIKRPSASEPIYVRHTAEVVAGEDGKIPLPVDTVSDRVMYPTARPGHPIRFINLGGGANSTSAGARTQISVTTGTKAMIGPDDQGNPRNVLKFYNKAANVGSFTPGNPEASPATEDTKTYVAPVKGDHIRIFWEEEVTNASNEQAIEVVISPETFPGTYRVVGDTFMRSEKTGKDEAFQFIINKAKVQSNVTITLQAEGDPATFEMTLNVLRSKNESGDSEMMKLVRYTFDTATSTEVSDDEGSLTTSTGT